MAGSLAFLALVLTAFPTVFSEDLYRVKTASGPVKGVLKETPLGSNVIEYLGIPFAAPPIGPLRFKAPVPVTSWVDVLDASVKGASCIQVVDNAIRNVSDPWWLPTKDEDISEDCLRLNIWVPDPLPEANTAVMVWIHGGGFSGGTANLMKYDGKILASEGGVIVVSVNYRLSAFGFLYLDPEEAPGNMGLMDQTLAMKWVKDNIINFGGDPNRITLFGESAGGASVSHHITIPSSKGLFKRVIAQSGVSNTMWGTTTKTLAGKMTEIVANASGCPIDFENRNKTLDCLRNLDANSLREIILNASSPYFPLYFCPVVDSNYIPVDSDKALIGKTISSDVDVMMGTTSEDGSVFPIVTHTLELKEDTTIDHEGFAKFIQTLLFTKDEMVTGLVQHFYTNWEDLEDQDKIREQLIHLTTDFLFLCKTNLQGDLLAENGNRIFTYQFSHKLNNSPFPKWLGTVHGDDIDFVFGWPLLQNTSYTSEEADLSRRMIGYWTNFAKFGDPNGPISDLHDNNHDPNGNNTDANDNDHDLYSDNPNTNLNGNNTNPNHNGDTPNPELNGNNYDPIGSNPDPVGNNPDPVGNDLDPNRNSPNPNDVFWPLYTKKTRGHLNIDVTPRIGNSKDLRVWQCALWNNLLPKVVAASMAAKGNTKE